MSGWKGYDSPVYVGYHGNDLWKDQWDWNRIRKLKKTYERLLQDLEVAMYNLGNKYPTVKEQRKAIKQIRKKLIPYELREIDKIHKELVKKELISPLTEKRNDGWSFDTERKDKNTKREYIVKGDTVDGKRIKKYVGRSWSDVDQKLRSRAYEIVWAITTR